MAKNRASDECVVAKFVKFQETGEGFDGVWVELEPVVKDFAGRTLKKLGVKASRRSDWAVTDVVSDTSLVLINLGNPTAKGKFDPSRAQPGLSGFRGWLWKVVYSQAANWARAAGGGRGCKIKVESSLEWNALPGDESGESVIDRAVAKIDRPDLLPILEECINLLEDPFHREIVRLKLDEIALRGSAKALSVSATTVQRELQKAFTLLRPMLEERGVDVSWLAA